MLQRIPNNNDDTYIARIYMHIKFGANRSRIGRDMPFCVFSKMAAAAILSFQKVTFWTSDDTYIVRIYKHTKFGVNRSSVGRDMPFCVFSKMAAAAILNFQKVLFLTPMTLVFLISVSISNLVQIDQELADICPFVYFPKWRPPPS